MNQLTTQLTGVPRTMLMTTWARVEEHQRPDAIFRDPQAAKWWQSLAWDRELDSYYTWQARLAWVVRANQLDLVAKRHLDKYPDAVVVELGSGLSTRFYRVGQDCSCWIELDLPEVTELRRQLDTETAQHRFLSYSALDFSWMDEIPPQSPQSILFIAEGLLMYFTASQVQQLIAQMRQRFPGGSLTFDVVGGMTKGKEAKKLAQLGAPLQWFVDCDRDVTNLGLTVLQVSPLLQLFKMHPERLGYWSWFGWLTKLPALRNASLILETQLQPL